MSSDTFHLIIRLIIRHVFHASTYEEATELLLRWAIEGVDCKIGGMSTRPTLFSQVGRNTA
jgi:hypothetical protein